MYESYGSDYITYSNHALFDVSPSLGMSAVARSQMLVRSMLLVCPCWEVAAFYFSLCRLGYSVAFRHEP